MQKLAITGAGRVGESTVQILAEEEFCREVVLIDIHDQAPQGAALDIFQTAAFFEVAAGVVRKPGMSRLRVLEINLTRPRCR
jgi:malate dehydrogenase